jgi:hypothetical protein
MQALRALLFYRQRSTAYLTLEYRQTADMVHKTLSCTSVILDAGLARADSQQELPPSRGSS